MRNDIQNRKDIELLVNTFYEKVKRDPLLAPVFQEKIPGDWAPHLDTMYRFWNAALLNVREYTGNPLRKHLGLPVQQEHFENWIALFYETIDELFEGPVSDEAKRKAMLMAHTFYHHINVNKKLSPLPPI